MSRGRTGSTRRAEDRAGVQALLDLEDRRTGHLVAVQHGVLDGCGAPPGRQQREVQVHPTVPGMASADRRNQRAVRHHRDAVRRELGRACPKGLIARPVRARAPRRRSSSAHLADRLIEVSAGAAAGRRVGPGKDGDNARVRDAAMRLERGDARPPAYRRRLSARSAYRAESGRVRTDLDRRRVSRVVPGACADLLHRRLTRAAASSRSRNSTPSRWSVSCWQQRGHETGADQPHRLAVLVEAGGDHVLAALGVARRCPGWTGSPPARPAPPRPGSPAPG